MTRHPTALLLAALGLLFGLLAAVPAGAATRLVIRGRGFGHGIGLSQYGALGYAKHGRDHRFILGHYYTGTTLGTIDPKRPVRVLLQSLSGAASFSGAQRVAGGRRLDPARRYTVVRRSSDSVELRDGPRSLGVARAPLQVLGDALLLSGAAQNGTSGGHYRTALEFRPSSAGGVSAVNALSIEDYVRGVVPVEVSASWPAEALRAQAIAARSYAVTTRAGGANFDQWADTRSQAYKGVDGEQPASDAAVAATRGQVVTYGGAPVTTFFFSTSGGRTEDNENSFLGSPPRPWLRSVDDPFDRVSPEHTWSVGMSLGQAQAKLGGLVKGALRGIDVKRRGVSPRVVSAEVVGTRGRTKVDGPQLKARFGLMDTWASFRFIGSDVRPVPGKPKPSPAPDRRTGGTDAGLRVLGRLVAGEATATPAGTRVRLQRRRGSHWHVVGSGAVGARGRYAIRAHGPGTYRVLVGGDAGPEVRV